MVWLIRPNEYDPETDSGDGFQFTYDAQGRVLTVLSPDGHVFVRSAKRDGGLQLEATRRFCVATFRPRGWSRLPARSALHGVSHLEAATGDPRTR